MAYGITRSANAELHIGATEGSYKKVNKDRGGYVEPTTYEARRDLHDQWYGIHETPYKNVGDGRAEVITRDFVATPAAHLD